VGCWVLGFGWVLEMETGVPGALGSPEGLDGPLRLYGAEAHTHTQREQLAAPSTQAAAVQTWLFWWKRAIVEGVGLRLLEYL